MKLIAFLTLVIASSSTFACPKLTGTFNCFNGKEIIFISNEPTPSGHTFYIMKYLRGLYDNKVKEYYSDNEVYELRGSSRQSKCTNNILYVTERSSRGLTRVGFGINAKGDLIKYNFSNKEQPLLVVCPKL